jgi:UDP-N-acetylmuramyl pentapeptide phosphotransferase/UDP-N-acetylglucosamine-1-phosphate transferase
VILTCALAFLVSLLGCEVLRALAVRRALFDRPNERSLHSVPTPRLGGLAVAGAALLVLIPSLGRAAGETRALIATSAVVAGLGLIDDLRPLPARLRLIVQLAVSAVFAQAIGPIALVVLPDVTLAVPAVVASAVVVVWMTGALNIYNFMDGMDGLAGSQAVIAGIASAVLVAGGGRGGQPGELALVAAVIAGASAGFVMHNFPPARIFMGDAGSTFVGFAFAGLAVLGMQRGVAWAATALPLSPFLLDGSFTLVRRALRREPIWTAHRSHLYQRAVQTGLGHRDVLLVYAGWMAIALAGAMWNPVLGWAGSGLALLGVWRWVVHREALQQHSPTAS